MGVSDLEVAIQFVMRVLSGVAFGVLIAIDLTASEVFICSTLLGIFLALGWD